MARAELSEEELDQLTGGKVPKQKTMGQKVVQSLMDTLGYAVSPAALAEISNKEALRQVAKVAAQAFKYRKENPADFKYTAKDRKLSGLATIQEVKGAPEGVFDKIQEIYFSPDTRTASYMRSGFPRGQGKGYVSMGPRRVDPEALRHETAHSWQLEYPDPAFEVATQEAKLARRHVESTFGIPEIVEDKMSKYIGEPWRGYHSLSPTEMNAEAMQKVPFKKFDTVDKYLETLGRNFVGKRGIGPERTRAAKRFMKQTAPDVLMWTKVEPE